MQLQGNKVTDTIVRQMDDFKTVHHMIGRGCGFTRGEEVLDSIVI